MELSNFVSSDMPNLSSIIAFVIIVLFQIGTILITLSSQRKEKLFHIITNKRRERMDDIRDYSALIMSICDGDYLKQSLSETKKNELIETLIRNVNCLKVLLQRVYIKDLEIIENAYQIKNKLIEYFSTPTNELLSELEDLTEMFYRRIDLYIGTEWERLKYEAHGNYGKYGNIDSEKKLWDSVYNNLEKNDTYEKMNTKKTYE